MKIFALMQYIIMYQDRVGLMSEKILKNTQFM